MNFEFGLEIYVVGNPRESWEPPPVGPTCVNCGDDFRFCFDWAVSRPEGNILAHIRTNPERILGAVFAIVIAWDNAGRRRTAEIRHEFIEACQSLDWIIQEVFHLPPLLEGHTEEILRMSDPALSWLRLVAIAVENKGRWEEAFSASEIADLCQNKGIELPGSTRITNDEQLSMHTGRLLGRLFADDAPVEIDRYKITRQTRQEYGANHKGIISKHYYFFQKRK